MPTTSVPHNTARYQNNTAIVVIQECHVVGRVIVDKPRPAGMTPWKLVNEPTIPANRRLPWFQLHVSSAGSFLQSFISESDSDCGSSSTKSPPALTHLCSFMKTGEKIFELLDKFVECIGEKNVVQVITDNGSNYVLAGKFIEAKRSHLYWTPCAAHCIDLILEDIGKLPTIKRTLTKAIALNGFIYNHVGVLNMMREFTKQRELLASKWAKEAKGKQVSEIVLMPSFWNHVVYILKVMGPLVKVLQLVDNERKPTMGKPFNDRVSFRSPSPSPKAFQSTVSLSEKPSPPATFLATLSGEVLFHTDHTIRCARRSSSSFVKAPEGDSQSRAGSGGLNLTCQRMRVRGTLSDNTLPPPASPDAV
ncbi:hypothetical protein CK203_005819 [Vitis vinifera]|uniref:DUF659 domain-containing protein n=1 Tax=Vitis vinifera TaxID=29760 RepID=A0A438K3Z6_VITVI|nr:hypothetical protein CK203_005819 [Vitis vinifera]